MEREVIYMAGPSASGIQNMTLFKKLKKQKIAIYNGKLYPFDE